MTDFKKGGPLQNSNIYATNRLFVKNPLFKKKKKKRAPGVYNPKGKFKYEDGGSIIDLTEEEIQKYIDGGYVVEEVNDPSIPALTKAAKGGASKGCKDGEYWDGTKCTKLITLKNDKKYIDGVANWAMHVSDPNKISGDYNDQIKDRLYSGKWGLDPQTGALVKLSAVQPKSVTTVDAKTKASREKEKLTEQNYKAEEENKKAYDKSITDAGFDPATFGKAKGVNTITGEPIYASSKEEADRINQEAINQFAIEGHAAVVNNPVFKAGAYMTPVGMAIGAMEGLARFIPDAATLAEDPTLANAGQLGMDALQVLPFAKPIANTVKSTVQNTYKINPWAFKPNPEAYYHRSPKLENIINKEENILQGFAKSDEGVAYSKNRLQANGEYLRPANEQLYFSKGVPLDKGRYNTAKNAAKEHVDVNYPGPYIAEVEGVPMGASVSGRIPASNAPTKLGDYAVPHRPIALDEAKFYKEHWLKGYVPVDKSKVIANIPDKVIPNKVVIPDNAIGVPEYQWKQMSDIHKKAFQEKYGDSLHIMPDEEYSAWSQKPEVQMNMRNRAMQKQQYGGSKDKKNISVSRLNRYDNGGSPKSQWIAPADMYSGRSNVDPITKLIYKDLGDLDVKAGKKGFKRKVQDFFRKDIGKLTKEAEELGKGIGYIAGVQGDIEPAVYNREGIKKFKSEVKRLKGDFNTELKDAEKKRKQESDNKAEYDKWKKKLDDGDISASEFLLKGKGKNWEAYNDVKVAKGSGPGADYSATDAGKEWGDSDQWNKFTGLVSNAATAIPLLGAAGAMGSAGAAILENPYVQAGLTGYGLYDATTNTLPEAYKDFSEGRYWEGLGNTALGALDFVPGVAFAGKGLGKAINYVGDLGSDIGKGIKTLGTNKAYSLANDPSSTAFYKSKNTGTNTSTGLTDADIAAARAEEEAWLTSDEYLKRRMKNTGESAKAVREDVAKILKRADKANYNVNANLKNAHGEMATNIFINPKVSVSKTAPNPKKVLRHENIHLYSPASKNKSILGTDLHKGWDNPNVAELKASERGVYANYPTIGDAPESIMYADPSDYHYNMLGYEQQARHLGAMRDIAAKNNVDIKAGKKLTEQQVRSHIDDFIKNRENVDYDYDEIWGAEILNERKKLADAFGAPLDEIKKIDPDKYKEIINVSKDNAAKRITKVLNNAWVVAPTVGVAGTATMLANPFQGSDGLQQQQYGGVLKRFIDGGEEDCPEGYMKNENGHCVPSVAPEQVDADEWYRNWYANRVIQDEEGQKLLNEARPKILKRAEKFPEVQYFEESGPEAGYYSPKTGNIKLNSTVVGNNPFLKNEVLFHEKGHYLTYPSLKDPEMDTYKKMLQHPIHKMKEYETDVIKNALVRKKNVPKKDREYFKYISGDYGEEISKRIMEMRRLAGFKPDQVITDKDVEDFYKKAAEKGWTNPESDKFVEPLHDLKIYTKSPEEIKNLLNKLAKNEPEQVDEFAPQSTKYGGSKNKYIELDIPEEEIQWYINNGYRVEPVSKLKKFIG